MSALAPEQRHEMALLQRRALGAGVVCLAACGIGATFSPVQFFRAYLAAYQFYLGLALGSLAILMLYHLTGGAWGFLIRRILEAAMRTLPILAVLFVPIALGAGYLYQWAQPEMVAESKDLQHKQIYLNLPFWLVRAALYFVIWITISYILSAWSRQQDLTGERQLPRKFRLLSAPGLVFFGIAITFASVDWVMSLQPAFHSTMFGPLFVSGQLVTAQAWAVLVLAMVVERAPVRNIVSAEVLNDVGNMLFSFLIIWAYMAWFQFMLVWMANLPEEVIWYLPRSQDGWQWVVWAIFLFHFAVPFFCLLMRENKRDPRTLGRIGAMILFMHLVYVYWQIMPAFPGTTLSQHWMDFLTPIGIGGIWLAYFLWRLGDGPLLPLRDPSEEEAEHLRRHEQEAAARQEALPHG
jgi:hypothetical protein